ncbi:MAG: acyltransferase [Alphaproteobacteria bacterium]|nr:MAG: acyltransferase [Alphaproteobacteria bacterium]
MASSPPSSRSPRSAPSRPSATRSALRSTTSRPRCKRRQAALRTASRTSSLLPSAQHIDSTRCRLVHPRPLLLGVCAMVGSGEKMEARPFQDVAGCAPRHRRLYGIQYLRAFAASSVVAVHASHRLFVFGLGVELFFVLSGFLMVAITDERSRSAHFLKDRIPRIVPVY